MKFNTHAGHNPDGKVACGSVGLIKESTQARKVNKYLGEYLTKAGHTVYDCTVNNGKNQDDVLNKIVAKCNAHDVDLDISIHFNSGRNDLKGDNSIGGIEVLLYNFKNDKLNNVAKSVADSIATDGFKLRSDKTTIKGMEGVKTRPELAVLSRTKAPAMLIECCFVDDKDDIKLYNAKRMAQAIAKGILNYYVPYKCITTKKISMYDNNMKKVGLIEKNHTCTIVEIDIKDGKTVGKLKKSGNWIKLAYTKLI